MIEALAILLTWTITYAVDTRIRLTNLENEVRYGTYPSELFPDDPRHKPAKSWWEYIVD